jgi:ParB family chromosome partitioning protein
MSVSPITPPMRMLPIASICANVNNPRKHFDPAKLKELAKSIEQNGVLEPVTVRPDPMDKNGKRFELIFGERRWRASKLAGQAEIPVIVRPVDDRTAIEMMVIENDQREDARPLEQARGYEALMSMPREVDGKVVAVTPTDIATRIGKSVEYVYARLKLLDLIPAGREALDSDLISAAHAVLIARLQPVDQILALYYSLVEDYAGANDRKEALAILDVKGV